MAFTRSGFGPRPNGLLRDERFAGRAEGFAARFGADAFLARVSFFAALFLESTIEHKTIAQRCYGLTARNRDALKRRRRDFARSAIRNRSIGLRNDIRFARPFRLLLSSRICASFRSRLFHLRADRSRIRLCES